MGEIKIKAIIRTTRNFNKPYRNFKKMRAKFRCESVTDFGNGYKKAKMCTHYSDNPEDNQFSEATPNGDLEMDITNKGANNFLQPGKTYYLDFSEAE